MRPTEVLILLTTLRPLADGQPKPHPPCPFCLCRRWMENIRDWCVSRQLWWGHRIPAFYIILEGGWVNGLLLLLPLLLLLLLQHLLPACLLPACPNALMS